MIITDRQSLLLGSLSERPAFQLEIAPASSEQRPKKRLFQFLSNKLLAPRKSEMPRKVILNIQPPPRSRDLQNLVYPLSVFGRCESAADVREGLRNAKDQKFISDEEILHYGESFQRSPDKLKAIDTETDRDQAALSAAYSLSQARILFKQAVIVPESVQPILYYYGSLSLMEFLTSCVVRRERVGKPGHGLSLSCDSEGWDFDRDWPRVKCRVKMGSTGDFPFFIDALTAGGWPSLFSGFGLFSVTFVHYINQPPNVL